MSNRMKMVFAILVIAGLTALLRSINLKRRNRGRQFYFPVEGFIYSAAMIAVLMRIRKLIVDLIETFSQWLDQQAGGAAIEALKNVLSGFADFEVLLFNAVLMLGFVLVKGASCLSLSASAKGKKDGYTLSRFNIFYEYDDELNRWFLIEKYTNIRQVFNFLTIAGAAACGIYLGLLWIYGDHSRIWAYTFPAAAQIILLEIYNFLNGYTREEYKRAVYGDDAYAERISNFYRMREIYEEMFPEPLLSAGTQAEFVPKAGVTDELKNLEESPDRAENLVSRYFSLYDKRNELDVDGIDAALQLIRGKNVIFFNPFYRQLSRYLVLPVVRTLISSKKILILAGRRSSSEDIKEWITDAVRDFSKVRDLWRVEELTKDRADCEIGILDFSRFYSIDTLEANDEFLRDVGMVILQEPSLYAETGQLGLSLIADRVEKQEKPVYCVIDRAADGLVDTLSHLLNTEFTNVVAPMAADSVCTGMNWDVDGGFRRSELFERDTQFLGNGVELAAVAVRNEVPRVTWFSEKKAPIRDIEWITRQHFRPVCKYMNTPVQQKTISERIGFVPNPWYTSDDKEQFIIVDDEICNMYSTMRTYMSIGENQTFVNVLSENYLFRDYMKDNSQIFLSNPNAIPSIVPDYARTERNTLMKLLFQMIGQPVRESEVLRELKLTGRSTFDGHEALAALIRKYTYLSEDVLTVGTTKDSAYNDVLYNDVLSAEATYRIVSGASRRDVLSSLRTAHYIVEEEEFGVETIDAKLYGHVTQTVLPGQFLTYAGKYYQVKTVSPEDGVTLRRASDLYSGRKYYRQVRRYSFADTGNYELDSVYKMMDIEFARLHKNITVETTGYLEMDSNEDLKNAMLIDFTGDEAFKNAYARSYKNKEVLRIRLPETTVGTRFTLCMLLNEAFRTLFPNSWPYITAVCARPEGAEEVLNYTVYPLDGDYSKEYIYFIEDSEVDLGLLGAVEKNFSRFMKIITEYLNWHAEKMEEEPFEETKQDIQITMPEDVVPEKRGLIARIADWFRRTFGKRRGTRPEPQDVELTIPPAGEMPESGESAGIPVPDGDGSDFGEPDRDAPRGDEPDRDGLDSEETDRDKPVGDEPESEDIKLSDIPGPDGPRDDGPDDQSGLPKKTKYQRECYLKFGFDEISSTLRLEELQKYLASKGWDRSALRDARESSPLEELDLDFNAENQCDFCGKPLSGISLEKLSDGRVRCNDCAASAINTSEQFVELFTNIYGTMQGFYGIRFNVPITVRMSDANEVAKGAHRVFKPSNEFAARVLGFAQKKGDKYSILVENGSPRLAAIDTIVHEMTHIWQYLNWDEEALQRVYGKNRNHDIVYEGMAMWSAIQYLYLIGEKSYAYQAEYIAERREDIYGVGFCLYRQKYPLIRDSSLLRDTPFMRFPPL